MKQNGHTVLVEKSAGHGSGFFDEIYANPSIVQLGSPEEVYEVSRTAIDKEKKHKSGFALTTGCELPPQSPPYNVWMMAKAVNDFGYYD